MKLVSIVVPMYNESKMIDDFFKALDKNLCGIKKIKKDIDFEIIAVNDGSKDGTLNLLKEWHKKLGYLSVVSLSRNFGQEPAVFAGLEKARGGAAIVMDCDLQDPPEFIVKMIEKWEEGFDVVNAKMAARKTDTAFKRGSAGLYYKLLNKLSYKVNYPENVNNFRLVSRRVLDVILKMPEKNKFYRGLVPFAGFKTAQIEIERQKRLKGESKYNLKAMVRLAADGITSTSTKPLLWSFKTGLVFSALSIAAATIMLILYACGNKTDYTLFSIISAMAFFTGILLLFLGIIGLYLAKAFEEIKARPFSIVEEYLPKENNSKDNISE